MTRLSGTSQAIIPASIERCWALVADLSRAPGWQQGLETVTVVERDDAGRPLVCDAVIDARFTRVACRVRIAYAPPHRMTFTRISGDPQAMEGSWELEALGPERTRATYALALDPGRVGLLARPLEKALRPLVVGGRPEELARALADPS